MSRWIEYHVALRDHWKIQRFADKSKMPYAQALGHISCLWLWAVEYAQNGNVTKFTDSELCRAARLESEIAIKKLLKECELLDAKEVINDWRKHGMKYLLSSRKRVEEHRKRVTLQKRYSNVTVTSTQPNPTQPNITKNKSVDHNYLNKKNIDNLIKLYGGKEEVQRHLTKIGFTEHQACQAVGKNF